jgi:hypothetical protein
MENASHTVLLGIDPGLRSGGIVALDQADHDRVLAAFSIVERSGDAKKALAEAKRISKELFGAKDWSDYEYTAASVRASVWIAAAAAALDEIEARFGPIVAVACESFVDQRSRAREEKNRLLAKRWQTPHVIGRLEALLESRGIAVANGRLVYQNAGIVLQQLRNERAIIATDAGIVLENDSSPAKASDPRHDGLVCPGDSLIGNEHELSALLHALALSFRFPTTATSVHDKAAA